MKNIEFINAGAGSGKTYFLSHKLAEVIMEDVCSAEEIIMTTFTEVAAAELQNKAHEALLEAGNQQQANLLASAVIGTVHSVALHLIQQYWQYLGIGVNLRVMPQEDTRFFLDQSLAFIPTPEELKKLDRLTALFDFQKGINEKDPDRWKNDLLDIIGKALSNRMENLEDSLNASLDELDRIFPDDQTWHIEKHLIENTLKSAHGILQDAVRIPANLTRINTVETLLNLDGNFGIGDLLSLQTFLAKLTVDIAKKLPERDVILAKLASIESSPLFKDGLREYIRLVFDLAGRSMDRYQMYKKENKLIDFNDMEVLFLKLLENGQARKEISSRYKMVFVDEFQDCSPIQVEIFCKLSDLVKKSFWVGDPKQAIYDFRGTDPLLIESVIKRIYSPNRDNLTLGNRLSESWRSMPEIIDLTNHIFIRTLADQVDPATIPLESIRTGEGIPNDDLHKPLKKWEFLDKNGNNEAFVHHLAVQISDLIQNTAIRITDKGKSKMDRNPENQVIITRPLKASDIVVLCRTNTRVYELTNALQKCGVQVAAIRKNLVDTAEMKLFTAVLNCYLDRNDTMAKATIKFLSEPEMDASVLIDERLEFLYGENSPARPETGEEENSAEWEEYYKKLSNWSYENPVLQKIEKIREHSGHLSVSSLVEKLVTVSGISDVVLKWSNPLQRRNNIQTLKKMAYDYENRCLVMNMASSLQGFIKFFDYFGNQEISQGAAAGDDAVNVMTYHKSKGLEWPVVILTQLDYDHFSDRNLFAQGYFGVSMDSTAEPDLDNPYNGKRIIVLPWPYGSLNRKVPAVIENRIMAEERFNRLSHNASRELKRLLYVGMTRARDIMIMVSYNQKRLPWVEHLTETWNAGHPEDPVFFWGRQDELLEQSYYFDNAEYPQPVSRQVSILAKHGPVMQDSPMFRNPSGANVIGDAGAELVKNFNFRVQRLPGANTEDNIVGNCLHNLFYSFIKGDMSGFCKIAQVIIRNYGLTGDLTHTDHIYQAAMNLYSFLEDNYGIPVKIHRELPLQMVKEGVVYTGSADLVWETEDALILVDYKSYSGQIGHVVDPEHEKYSGRYSGQLALYKEMLEKCHPQKKPVKDCLIYYAVLGVIVKMNFV